MPRPVHFEIFGDNPEKVAAFYGSVFGWSIERWGEVPYWLADTGEGPGIHGAIAPPNQHGQKVVLTMAVDDLDDAVALIENAGGSVLAERSTIPGVGDFAHAFDPNGVLFGILRPLPTGEDRDSGPGGV
jgi:uncharacterized protein